MSKLFGHWNLFHVKVLIIRRYSVIVGRLKVQLIKKMVVDIFYKNSIFTKINNNKLTLNTLTMNNYKINIFSGDQVEDERMIAALKVLTVCAETFNFELSFDKKSTPNDSFDAILLNQMDDSIQKLFKKLNIYVNISYTKVYSALTEKSPVKPYIINGTDIIIYKELLTKTPEKALSNIIHSAFKSAEVRQQKLCLAGKISNLESSNIWYTTVKKIAKDYPNIDVSYMSIDLMTKELVVNPRQFDVILTENVFGDILSNLTSLLTSSVGLLPNSFLGENTAFFGPNKESTIVNKTNPIALILSGALMLEYLGELDAAIQIVKAVNWTIENRMSTEDVNAINPVSCATVGNKIVDFIKNDGKMITEKKPIVKEEFLYR